MKMKSSLKLEKKRLHRSKSVRKRRKRLKEAAKNITMLRSAAKIKTIAMYKNLSKDQSLLSKYRRVLDYGEILKLSLENRSSMFNLGFKNFRSISIGAQ